MKSYPSMKKAMRFSPPDVSLYTFDKIDGSNLRFEWTRKRGWWKTRTRERLLDRTDQDLGAAIDIFERTHAEPLARFAHDQKWDPFVAFVEFYGPSSFAGLHRKDEEKKVALIDLCVHKEGIIRPSDFLNVVNKTGVHAPRYLGFCKWNRTFLDEVSAGAIPEISFEGVVGKLKHHHDDLILWKAKTDAWRDAVKNKFETAVALKLIES